MNHIIVLEQTSIAQRIIIMIKEFIRRTHLAILDHNHKRLDEENGKRKQIGKKAYRYCAKHRDGEFVTKIRKSPPDFTWKRVIAAKAREHLPKIKKTSKSHDEESTLEEYTDDSDMHDSDQEVNPVESMNRMILNEFGLESEYESDDE
uniref:Uncharacterized protein n=1 Tax=Panagrolaimus superbus TaxID=310955 RepID=A0A914YPP7_9BILA